jgi:hypothetical protein
MEEDIRWKQRFGNYLKARTVAKFIAKDKINWKNRTYSSFE